MKNVFFIFFLVLPLWAMEQINTNDEKCQTHVDNIISMIKQSQYLKLDNYLINLRKNRLNIEVLNCYDNRGLTLLHIALIENPRHYKIIKLLLDFGAKVNKGIQAQEYIFCNNKTAYKGWTEAHLAVEQGVFKKTIDLLHSCGTDFFKQDEGGYSAYDISKKKNKKIHNLIYKLQPEITHTNTNCSWVTNKKRWHNNKTNSRVNNNTPANAFAISIPVKVKAINEDLSISYANEGRAFIFDPEMTEMPTMPPTESLTCQPTQSPTDWAPGLLPPPRPLNREARKILEQRFYEAVFPPDLISLVEHERIAARNYPIIIDNDLLNMISDYGISLLQIIIFFILYQVVC